MPVIATSEVMVKAGARHAAVTEGLAALAAFLEAHPDLPLGYADPFRYSVHVGGDAENRAEVDRIAAILGVTAGDDGTGGTHWTASRDFGGGVRYTAWTITRAETTRWSTHMAAYHQVAGVAA